MPWLAIAILLLAGALLVLRVARSRSTDSRKYDVGTVSEYWLQGQGRRLKDDR
jgi:hypothetical protein